MSDLGRKVFTYLVAVARKSAILAILFVGVCLFTATCTNFAQSPEIHSVELVSMQTSPSKSELEKKKLQLEVENSERSLFTITGWRNLIFQNPLAAVTLVVGLFGLVRYFDQRRKELSDGQHTRFEEIVRNLGGDREQQRVSSALLLPTYLRPGFEDFYVQVFNLAAGNLRSATLSASAEAQDLELSAQARSETNGSKPSPLKQALASVLRESFPLARDTLGTQNERQKIDNTLNATGVNLDRAYLGGADLRKGSWREASFREARLSTAELEDAVLEGADFSGAELDRALLLGVNLSGANFTGANLNRADLSRSHVDNAVFRDAILSKVIMEDAIARGVDFSGADLTDAQFKEVDFRTISPNTKVANPEAAKSLTRAIFEDVRGLSEPQIALCEHRGAQFRSSASSSESESVDNGARVLSIDPPDRAEDVSPDTLLTVTFSRDMNPTTINTTTFKLSEQEGLAQIAGDVVYDRPTRRATFTPAAPLEDGRAYEATISASVEDHAGNTLAEDYTWHVRIKDQLRT